jgi:solute carrier family 13 (sodium-dependent dicarboxylate transporter), member 2/3/5
VRLGGLFTGIGVLILILLLPAPQGWSDEAWRVLGCVALMVCWWISEAIPVYATGLAPIVLFPLLGIASPAAAAAPYANPLIFLFLGGFMIAQAIQRWGLHRRIALGLLALTGTGPRALLGGFMAACAFLSMWISNTATAVMMLPIALSVVVLIEESSLEAELERRFERALLLAIAYACSIGGIATLIGTPPNAMLAAYLAREHDVVITFASWMAFALPLSLLLLVLAWWLLTRLFRLPDFPIESIAAMLEEHRSRLGAMSRGERLTLFGFLLAAALWIGRGLIDRLAPGLNLSDAGIAIGVALLLFALPVDAKRGINVLNWEDARKLPWGVLLLFGGGLSLAAAVDGSGLAGHLGGILGQAGALPWWLLVLLTVTAIVFLTEVMSNTATTAAFLPIVAGLAFSFGHAPVELAAPMALAASCAFMLPAATPPNAVVFGSGRLAIHQMARAGLLFNLMAIVLITAVASTPLIGWLLR